MGKGMGQGRAQACRSWDRAEPGLRQEQVLGFQGPWCVRKKFSLSPSEGRRPLEERSPRTPPLNPPVWGPLPSTRKDSKEAAWLLGSPQFSPQLFNLVVSSLGTEKGPENVGRGGLSWAPDLTFP